MKAIASFAIAMAALVPVATSSAETLQTCAAKPDATRLACYDGLAEAAVLAVAAPTKGKWTTHVQTSPVDDSKNVFLEVTGTDGITDQYGRESEITLTLACRENVTAAILNFGGLFMSDLNGAGRVTYRVDTQAAQTKSFSESNNHEALGLWNGGTSIPWIKSLFGGSKMYVEATPYSENAVSDYMPIAGLEEAIAPLREACGW
ncbi:type VI secretion system-associated protein TagO [Devosia sp. CAU 1758]